MFKFKRDQITFLLLAVTLGAIIVVVSFFSNAMTLSADIVDGHVQQSTTGWELNWR